jgi:hypothetical protein
MLRRKLEEIDEARLELKEFSLYVELEIFRMQALLRYEALALELRIAQVEEMQQLLLAELQEYCANTSVKLMPQIEEMIFKVKTIIGMTKGESK